ncbi:hypothetical protein ACHAWF_018906 [Thalassiosira exigua]
MTLFSSLRGGGPRGPTPPDEKEHDSDATGNGDDDVDVDVGTGAASSSSSGAGSISSTQPQRTPLLLDHREAGNGTFSLRIKLNDGKSTVDFPLDGVPPGATVKWLKDRILALHGEGGAGNGVPGGSGGLGSPSNGGGGGCSSLRSARGHGSGGGGGKSGGRGRYLRLIVRGRMLAPDASPLDSFPVAADNVVHAVLAREGARGGQQARMLRRMNHRSPSGAGLAGAGGGGGGGGGGGVATASGPGSGSNALDRAWRRIGIDSNGVVIAPAEDEDATSDDESDDEEEDEDDFEDAHGEIDLEAGGRGGPGGGERRPSSRRGGIEEGSGGQRRRRRRRRERRGFDRLRATGMTRSEVTAIRLYFARSVDRYIERRRVMIRASRRLRESLRGIVDGGGSSLRPRSDTSGSGGSSNSLLAEDPDSASGAQGGAGADGDNANGATGGSGGGSGSGNSSEGGRGEGDGEGPGEGEEILLDRRRMEDEWMSTQGPYSEFRLNLNTSNPLLLAAITGGGGGNAATTLPPGLGGGGADAGLFFRSRNPGLLPGSDPEDEEDGGGLFDDGGYPSRIPGGARGPHWYRHLGPLPPAGTDKDFVWGFILGFFVGFIMLFWVWMPTVPHKQKVGIISGISFQLGLNALRKSGRSEGDAVI